MALISKVLYISHFEISGKELNDLHPINKPLIFITSLQIHPDIFGKVSNCSHPENI